MKFARKRSRTFVTRLYKSVEISCHRPLGIARLIRTNEGRGVGSRMQNYQFEVVFVFSPPLKYQSAGLLQQFSTAAKFNPLRSNFTQTLHSGRTGPISDKQPFPRIFQPCGLRLLLPASIIPYFLLDFTENVFYLLLFLHFG